MADIVSHDLDTSCKMFVFKSMLKAGCFLYGGEKLQTTLHDDKEARLLEMDAI